jgi:hypothetical protein
MMCAGENPRDERRQEVQNLSRTAPGAFLIGHLPARVPVGADALLVFEAVLPLPVAGDVVSERPELFLGYIRCGLQR